MEGDSIVEIVEFEVPIGSAGHFDIIILSSCMFWPYCFFLLLFLNINVAIKMISTLMNFVVKIYSRVNFIKLV